MAEQKKLRIGDFIISKLNIPKEEVYKYLNMQAYLDEKIGEIATQENLLSEFELQKVLEYQKANKVTFGNAAIVLGFLRSSQLKYLLDIQAQKKQRIGELLVQEGVITQEKLFVILDEFYAENKTQFNILALANKPVVQEVQDIIKKYHYELTDCKSKEKLVSTIKREKPHLILLDTEEEEEVGELIKKIKEAKASSNVKIALLSPKKEKFKMLSGYELGIDYYIPLPFEAKDLINIIIDSEIQHAKRLKQRVLVVDDSRIVRSSVTKELHESGFQTITAENGKEAVELASLEKPDLITMDINMPIMNGYEACEKIKTNPDTHNIPIIILTSNNTQEEREKGFEVGAIEYFTKPFTKGYLSNYILHLLSSSNRTRKEKILVADDSRICRNIFSSVLDKYGFEYEMVENGQKVLDLLKAGYNPSTILLDHQMPVLDGLQTCEIIKEDEQYQHIPVIMVTGSTEKDNVLKGLKSGADDYLTKPFDGDELIARIETHTRNFSLLEKLRIQYKMLSESQNALMNSQAYSRNIIDSSIDMIVSCDKNGKIVEFNNAAEIAYGYTKEEVTGKDISLLYATKDDDEKVKNDLQKTGKYYGEISSKRKDGTLFPASISSSYLKDSMGEMILGTMGVSRDITLLREAEEELKKAKVNAERYAKEAEEANKAKSNFLASMSHEIRTPLNAIIGMADFLNDTKLSIEQEEYVGTFQNAGESLLALINDILDLSKIEAGHLELETISFDLQELTEKTTEIMAMNAHGKGLDILFQIKSDVQTRLKGDPNRLRQIIVNLTGNAIKFTKKGEVRILVEKGEETKENYSLKFTVSDTGIGIPDDKKEKVFESFSQADNSTSREFGGTGLGLSISKQLVEMMKGKIWVEGTYGEGSDFCFTAALEKGEKVERRQVKRDENALIGVHALIIEENVNNRLILKETLESFGLEVIATESKNAVKEINMSGKASQPFDIIFLNSHDVTTMESIHKVGGISQKVIMLLTCDDRVKQKELMGKFGVVESILKPVKRGMIYKMVVENLKKQFPEKYSGLTRIGDKKQGMKGVSKTSTPLTILLAEDNKVNQGIAVKTLGLNGHKTVIAENGKIAVEKFLSEKFDLILMDVNMPEMDGHEATQLIREREIEIGGRIPIIAMTAMAFAEDKQKCFDVGMDDYVSKPLRREEFLNKIEEYADNISTQDVVEENKIEEKEETLPDDAFDYEKALYTAASDEEFLKEMLTIFLSESDQDLASIETAVKEDDADALRRAAHRLKGGASTIAANRVQELGATLEAMGKSGDIKESKPLVTKLADEMKHLESIFSKLGVK